MENLDGLLDTLDYMLNTHRKRHIAGGLLLSLSALFAGIAVTVMTVKETDDE